jgi:hypothetical protein
LYANHESVTGYAEAYRNRGRISNAHVFALHHAKEKWEGAPLLESGGKPARRRRPSCPASGIYLEEINDSQHEVWRKSIEVFEDGRSASRTVPLFAEDQTAPVNDEQVIQIRLKDLKCVTRDNGVKRLIVWLMPSNIRVELQSGL